MTVPDAIKPLLDDYLVLINQAFPDWMIGFYLHGSIALGAFDPKQSDIDFMATLNSGGMLPHVPDPERLEAIHEHLKSKYPQWQLEGSYISAHDLHGLPNLGNPVACYHDGKFEYAGFHDLNPVTCWVLKKYGIVVVGSEASFLPIEANIDQLLTYMKENLNSYWGRFTREPRRIAWLFSDYGIQWVVLGVLRQFYTLNEHEITSKIGAGEYALQQLPAGWHRIIQEALNIRQQNGRSLYSFRIVRAIEAFKFLRFIIHSCNSEW